MIHTVEGDRHATCESRTRAVVPALWRLEVANSLTVAARRNRIDLEFRRAARADLALLDIGSKEQLLGHPVIGHSWEGTSRQSLDRHYAPDA